MHDTLRHLHGRSRSTGTTLDRFRLNELVSQIAYARRRALPAMTFTVGVAQGLDLPDSSFDVVTCTLAMHHIPARQRAAAVGEMYRVTRPGGRLLIADFDLSRSPLPLHPGGQRMRRASATVGPLANWPPLPAIRSSPAAGCPCCATSRRSAPPTTRANAEAFASPVVQRQAGVFGLVCVELDVHGEQVGTEHADVDRV